MTKPNPFLWPKGSTIVVQDRSGEICRSSDRRFDLADGIMLRVPTNQRTVTISVTLDDTPPGIEDRLEDLIRYDLEFDGYRVTLTRQEPQDVLVSYEWRAIIRPA